MFSFPNAFVHFWVWQGNYSGCNFASEIKNNTNMKTILFVISFGLILSSCATPVGNSSNRDSADSLTMKELEDNFDSCQFANTLDSIANIKK